MPFYTISGNVIDPSRNAFVQLPAGPIYTICAKQVEHFLLRGRSLQRDMVRHTCDNMSCDAVIEWMTDNEIGPEYLFRTYHEALNHRVVERSRGFNLINEMLKQENISIIVGPCEKNANFYRITYLDGRNRRAAGALTVDKNPVKALKCLRSYWKEYLKQNTVEGAVPPLLPF